MGDYQEVLHFLYEKLPMYQRSGATAVKKDLRNIRYLCHFLGHPHRRLKCIHIAGTNGKGSVSHMIAACLQTAGLRVGLYTSPHYRDFRERIKINGELIPEERVIEFVRRVMPAISSCKPSFFEITVAMAFDYFAKERTDVVVVETGLGGRLDSTNVIEPILSVITNISFDHQDMLGSNIADIAGEKAGIIKNGVPVVIGEHGKESDPVLKKVAKALNASLYFAEDLLEFTQVSKGATGMQLSINSNSTNFDLDQIYLGLAAAYQMKNGRTAMVAMSILRDLHHWPIDDQAIAEGLKNVRRLTNMIGRWQLLGEQPDVIADSAHNEAGIRSVIGELKSMAYPALHLVVGFVKGKEIEKLIRWMPEDAIYYVAAPKLPRALDAGEVLKILQSSGREGKAYDSVYLAVEAARNQAAKEDGIFIGGSSYVVAEVI